VKGPWRIDSRVESGTKNKPHILSRQKPLHRVQISGCKIAATPAKNLSKAHETDVSITWYILKKLDHQRARS